MPSPCPLHALLDAVPRRYRLAGAAADVAAGHAASLAQVIGRLQAMLAAGQEPDPPLRDAFVASLDGLIRDALSPQGADPAFQAAVLAYRLPVVREYLALDGGAAADRRRVQAVVDAWAHPGKPARLAPGDASTQLAQLHAAARAADWWRVAELARNLPLLAEVAIIDDLASALRALDADPALARLCRIETLARDPQVCRYRSLRAQLGPRAGSDEAGAQARLARQRGAMVETLAAHALGAVADYLGRLEAAATAGDAPRYRVVTSLRVPAGLAAEANRAKTEWDAVLLRRVDPAQATAVHAQAGATATPADPAALWDICLVIEAKASVEAATTDLPRLLRGLRLLASARPDRAYAFSTQQGRVQVRGHRWRHCRSRKRRWPSGCCTAATRLPMPRQPGCTRPAGRSCCPRLPAWPMPPP